MERVQMNETLEFSRIIQGFWRLAEWNMTKQELLSFIEDCMDMGITTLITLIFTAHIHVKGYLAKLYN